MTLHDWETQVRGRMLQLPDRVLYTWDRAVNERPAPDFGRITREFLTAWEGDRARWDKLIAVDVQRFPWVAVGIFDVYRDPRTPSDAKTGLLWMVDEVAMSASDEVDVCRELGAKGYDGERCLVVTDASCEWQQLERDQIRQRPNYKGKGTNYILRENGFPHVVPPDRSSKANPDIRERIRATNACIRLADDVPSLFIDGKKCPTAVDSARKWRMHMRPAASCAMHEGESMLGSRRPASSTTSPAPSLRSARDRRAGDVHLPRACRGTRRRRTLAAELAHQVAGDLVDAGDCRADVPARLP